MEALAEGPSSSRTDSLPESCVPGTFRFYTTMHYSPYTLCASLWTHVQHSAVLYMRLRLVQCLASDKARDSGAKLYRPS